MEQKKNHDNEGSPPLELRDFLMQLHGLNLFIAVEEANLESAISKKDEELVQILTKKVESLKKEHKEVETQIKLLEKKGEKTKDDLKK